MDDVAGYVQFTEEYAVSRKDEVSCNELANILGNYPLQRQVFEAMYRYQVPGALPEKLGRMMLAEAKQCSSATGRTTNLKLRLVARSWLESTRRDRLLSVMPFDAADFNWDHFALFLIRARLF